MARVLILGYGNPLRSDDGLGWQIAVELFRTNRSPDIQVLPCQQLTPELAPCVSKAERVLFIDCAREGQPGELRCDELAPGSSSPSFTHHLTPAVLLALSSELYGACPQAYALTICGQNFEPGDDLSATVSGRVGELKSRVRRMAEEWLAGQPEDANKCHSAV